MVGPAQRHCRAARAPLRCAAAILVVAAVACLLLRPASGCSEVHNMSPQTAGRTGLKVQINVLAEASLLDRLDSFTSVWSATLDRSTTEFNLFLNKAAESDSHQELIRGDNLVFVDGPLPRDRFNTLLHHVAQHSSCEIEWFVFVDDDTVLFHQNLVEALAQYDPDDLLYIGNGSEERIQVALHGWFAQGGGGIVLSRALLKALPPHIHHSGCLGNASAVHGDEKLRDCVVSMGVPLTVFPGLHQMDMRGDLSGFMEGHAALSRPLMTLHHLAEGASVLMPGRSNRESVAALYRAHEALPRAFMSRYVLRVHEPGVTVLLTVGYSVQVIGRIVSDEELAATEATMSPWRLEGWDHVEFRGYVFPSRPTEPSKNTYYFQDYYKQLKLQVYGDAEHNTIIVICGLCRDNAPFCLKHTGSTRSRTVLKLNANRCATF